jgi:hypothetical protein
LAVPLLASSLNTYKNNNCKKNKAKNRWIRYIFFVKISFVELRMLSNLWLEINVVVFFFLVNRGRGKLEEVTTHQKNFQRKR